MALRRRSCARPPTRARPTGAEALESRRLLAAHLVEDINVSPWNGVPSNVTDIGNGVALFLHGSGATGAEPYRTDGTPQGTRLLKDVFPGRQPSDVRGFIPAGDVAYFLADDGPVYHVSNRRHELWRSDGTAEGTFSLSDNDPQGPRALGGITPVGEGRRVFFMAEDAATGWEWWVTDGAPNDARIVTDLVPGYNVMYLNAFGTPGTLLLFQPFDQPDVLYASDGTAAGTVPILHGVKVESGASNVGYTNLAYSNVGFSNAGFVRIGNVAYFVDENTGSLWRTDGTAVGTVKVADRAMPDLRLIEVAAAGDSIVFVGLRRSDDATRVFRYDPGVGVRPVTLQSGQHPDRGGNWPLRLTSVGATAYFTAGGAGGTRALYRLAPGSPAATAVTGVGASSFIDELKRVGDTLYFLRDGTDIMKVTGPTAGAANVTRMLDVDPMVGRVPSPRGFAAVGDRLVFTAYDRNAGYELFRSDGTAEGTKLINDTVPSTLGSGPTDFAPLGDGRYLFSADDGVHGREPYVTDGTAEGTFPLGDLNAGREPSNSWNFVTVPTPAGPRAFFAATDGGGAQLWTTDGTPAGTRRVKVINPSPFATGFYPRSITAGLGPAAGLVYFAADDGVHGFEVWRSDGTADGTYMIADEQPAELSGEPELTAMPDGSLLFVADDGVHGRELWRTDGTAAGTAMLKDIRPEVPGEPATGSMPEGLSRAGQFVYFRADDGVHGAELWRTDGTAAGTVLVADIDPGPRSSAPGYGGYAGDGFVEFGGRVYFAAQRPATGYELWRTDGTAGGTELFADVPSRLGGSEPNRLRVVGGRLYFTAMTYDPQFGEPTRQLWSTDGTYAGTTLTVPADVARDVEAVTEVAGRPFFRARLVPTENDPFAWELFTTDGTPQGTRRLEDPGGDNWQSALDGRAMALPDGSILTVGNDGVTDFELFRLDNPWAARVVGRYVFYNQSAFDGGNPAAEAVDDAAIAPDKSPLLLADPGGGQASATFANVTSYHRGINGVIVDIANAPAGLALNPDDFDFGGANLPFSYTVRRGAGVGGSDRVTFAWMPFDFPFSTEARAVVNGWLYVTVKANARTGLSRPDRFAFGNLPGESGNSNLSASVNALDLAAVRRQLGSFDVPITSRVDFDRDGRVNAIDLALAKRNLGRSIPMPLATAAPLPPQMPRIAEDEDVSLPSSLLRLES